MVYEYDRQKGMRGEDAPPAKWTSWFRRGRKWSGIRLSGCIDKLPYLDHRRNGPFEVSLLVSSPEELKSVLESYIAYNPNPKEPLDLLVEMLPKAVAKLKEEG